MEIKIVKEENSISIKNIDANIETYNFVNEISFSELVKFLLNKNLAEKVEIKDMIDEKNEAEINSIKIINEIVNEYNSKVDEYTTFINGVNESK